MSLGDCTVTISGIEVRVTSVEVSYTPPIAYTDFGGRTYYEEPKYQEVEIRGVLLPEGIKKMCYEDEKAAYEPKSLSKRLLNAGLDEDERLLQKYNVVREDGTLTEQGKDLLLNVLFDEKADDVVSALQAIEDAEKEE